MRSYEDFVLFSRTLAGRTLRTAGGRSTFKVLLSKDEKSVFFMDTPSGVRDVRLDVTAVLGRFAETGDLRPGRYSDLTRRATYVLAVIAAYQDAEKAGDSESARGSSLTSTKAKLVGRLPASVLRQVTSLHVWNAVQQLLGGASSEPFIHSTKFDLLTDEGSRLPPKAVFGLALSAVIGRRGVPGDFTGGEDSLCFDILREHGYRIVPKDEAAPRQTHQEEDEFPEGMQRLRAHAGRERSASARQAKKAQFIAEFGTLGCERCGDDFTQKYGALHADACIEVHHHALAIQDMPAGYRTKLDDLQCLCANCHRVVHRELRMAAAAKAAPQ